MKELIQSRTIVDMIVFKRGCTEAYARQLIIRHRRLGNLKARNTLRFGTRNAYLYDPDEVNKWFEGLTVYNKRPIDKGII